MALCRYTKRASWTSSNIELMHTRPRRWWHCAGTPTVIGAKWRHSRNLKKAKLVTALVALCRYTNDHRLCRNLLTNHKKVRHALCVGGTVPVRQRPLGNVSSLMRSAALCRYAKRHQGQMCAPNQRHQNLTPSRCLGLPFAGLFPVFRASPFVGLARWFDGRVCCPQWSSSSLC